MMNQNSKTTKSKVPVSPFIVLSDIAEKGNKIIMDKNKTIIGRMADLNDIALLPDPQKLVTRYMHCSIEIRNGTSWVVDNASKNGTFVKRRNAMQKVKGELKLQDKDVIMILREVGANTAAKYWEMVYTDPLATEDLEYYSPTLIYDWIQAKLFINRKNELMEVGSLTPLEHKLLRFMEQKNKSNNGIPVMCTYDEIISALWEDVYAHTTNDVNHVVAALRKKIEDNHKTPKFLINIRGMGYRLNNKPI